MAGHLPFIISGNDARRSTYVRMLKTPSDIGTRVVEREHLDGSTDSVFYGPTCQFDPWYNEHSKVPPRRVLD